MCLVLVQFVLFPSVLDGCLAISFLILGVKIFDQDCYLFNLILIPGGKYPKLTLWELFLTPVVSIDAFSGYGSR